MSSLVPGNPSLTFFQEIRSGDVLKFKAVSNVDPSAGGGARDLRVPKKFAPFLREIFDKSGNRKDVWVAQVHWVTQSGAQAHAVELWRPTKARAVEWRIARVHELDLELDEEEFKQDRKQGLRWFFAIVKDDSGRVWIRLFKEKDLEGEVPPFKNYVRQRIQRTRIGQSVRGTIRWHPWEVNP